MKYRVKDQEHLTTLITIDTIVRLNEAQMVSALKSITAKFKQK
jgi:hypothetical protein